MVQKGREGFPQLHILRPLVTDEPRNAFFQESANNEILIPPWEEAC